MRKEVRLQVIERLLTLRKQGVYLKNRILNSPQNSVSQESGYSQELVY